MEEYEGEGTEVGKVYEKVGKCSGCGKEKLCEVFVEDDEGEEGMSENCGSWLVCKECWCKELEY